MPQALAKKRYASLKGMGSTRVSRIRGRQRVLQPGRAWTGLDWQNRRVVDGRAHPQFAGPGWGEHTLGMKQPRPLEPLRVLSLRRKGSELRTCSDIGWMIRRAVGQGDGEHGSKLKGFSHKFFSIRATGRGLAAMAKNLHLTPSVSEPSEIRMVSEVFVEFMFPKYRVPQVEAERFWWFLVLSQQ